MTCIFALLAAYGLTPELEAIRLSVVILLMFILFAGVIWVAVDGRIPKKLTSGVLVFSMAAILLSMHAYPTSAEKQDPTARVVFPRTDADQEYLFDRGSVVSNSFVHLDFYPSVVLPSSAMIYLVYVPIDDVLANLYDDRPILAETVYTNATLATFPRPLDFGFPNAISNVWYCFTDWTPGPSVHTNGVAQIFWQLPTSGDTNVCAMLNTAIYTNDTKVITQ